METYTVTMKGLLYCSQCKETDWDPVDSLCTSFENERSFKKNRVCVGGVDYSDLIQKKYCFSTFLIFFKFKFLNFFF
jgi:hypothetical protein